MPELPEVETTLRGIEPYVTGKTIKGLTVRNASLRWPVSTELQTHIQNTKVLSLQRRAKYLVFEIRDGFFMLHLGMSGSLRIVDQKTPLLKHDHLIFALANKKEMRFNDPRRFGCALWLGKDPFEHSLLKHLGFEPLEKSANAERLFQQSRRRKVAVKNFIMDHRIIVGVGNIYASESLFLSGIRPGRAANRVTRREYQLLLTNIQSVLAKSIEMGGSTLKDFVGSDGKPGYFQQTLNVYGRNGEPCVTCNTTIKNTTIGQRSSFYCPNCQK